MRAVRRVPSLRRQVLFDEMRRDFSRASRAAFRVVHFSVQSNHVHLVVEAHDKAALSRGMAGLSIRLARSVNRVLSRRGRVWGDRYHARALRTPRETRHAIVYVLMNFKKHARGRRGIDAMSSAPWFDGWKGGPREQHPTGNVFPTGGAQTAGARDDENDDTPVWRARTWLAREGWRRLGLIGADECPTPASRSRMKTSTLRPRTTVDRAREARAYR